MLLLATLLLTCALQTHAQTSASVAVNSNLTGVGFFYPPFPDLVGLDTKIHVNYLDAIDVLWSGNTSIGPHAEDPSSYLGVQCWKTNATTEGIWYTIYPDLDANLTDASSRSTLISPSPGSYSLKVNMTDYQKFNICQFFLQLISGSYPNTTENSMLSGAVDVDHHKRQRPVVWSMTNPAPLNIPKSGDGDRLVFGLGTWYWYLVSAWVLLDLLGAIEGPNT